MLEKRTVGRQNFLYMDGGVTDDLNEFEPLNVGENKVAETVASYDANAAVAQPLDPAIFERMRETAAEVGGPWQPEAGLEDVIAWTMFDSPGSDDNTITILLERENIRLTPSQAMVRIVSRDQSDSSNRTYLGIVTSGPFADPDGLRADAPLIITTTVKGMVFTPQYHGRCEVELMGEEIDGQLMPPRFRPLPKSPVWVLSEAETAHYLKAEGDIKLGRASGHENITVGIPSDKKSVLPRHTGILGTTGGGKSTTVSRLIGEAQKAGYAVIVLDVEGEYTFLAEPTEDPTMLTALQKRGLKPEGIQKPYILHLVGRETANPDYKYKRAFSLPFSNLSPYFLKEILDLSEPQELRFFKAYEWTKQLLRDFNIYPTSGNAAEEMEALALDEFDTGVPRMRLEHLIDVASYYVHELQHTKSSEGKGRGRKEEPEENEADVQPAYLRTPEFHQQRHKLAQRIRKEGQDSAVSWLALLARLNRLRRLNVFDRDNDKDGQKVAPLDYPKMLQPGTVYIVDLSDTGSPDLNNLVITEILRGIQQAQDAAYERHEKQGEPLTKVMLIIEEAHEFLSDSRISRMPLLFEQVARIAKRGRKRWLSLVFVTQLPQHLPRELLGLINNFILHKINDANTVAMLQKTVPGIDSGLWKRLPGLAPGQAIVRFEHMTRPLLVAIDPTPAKLRMVD